MKLRQDAHGQAFYDCYLGADNATIVERDDGYFEADRATASYLAPFARWSPRERQAMRLVVGRILDVGCGAGRHALHLQGRGHEVLGIDVSPLAIKVCRLRGLRRARVMSLGQVSRKTGVFDTILMMGNNFGLFGDPHRARRLLRRLSTATSPRARIIAECVDPYATRSPHHRRYHRFNRGRGRMGGQLRIRIRYRDAVTPWFDYLFVSREEMRRIFKGTGWCVRRFLPPRGGRYIAVIEKEGGP